MTKGDGAYTNKIDNWSLGVILYICLVGYPPFSDEDTSMSLERQIIQGKYDFPSEFWSGISKEAIDLVKRLMCVDPVKRASLDEVLEHPWIKKDTEMIAKANRLMNTNTNTNTNGQSAKKKQPLEHNHVENNNKKVKISHSIETDKSNDSN